MINIVESIQDPVQKRNVASIAAQAYFYRMQWCKLEEQLDFCKNDSVNIIVIKALCQVHSNNQKSLKNLLQNALILSLGKLAQSSNMAFNLCIVSLSKAQQFTEIVSNETSEWNKRLSVVKQSYNVYHKILQFKLTYLNISLMRKPEIKMFKLRSRAKILPFLILHSTICFQRMKNGLLISTLYSLEESGQKEKNKKQFKNLNQFFLNHFLENQNVLLLWQLAAS